MKRMLTVCVCALGLGACTQVTVVSPEAVDISSHFGVLKLSPNTKNKPTYVQTNGLGAIMGIHGLNIGLVEQSTVIFPDGESCRVVFVIQNSHDVEALKTFFQESKIDIANICMTGEGI